MGKDPERPARLGEKHESSHSDDRTTQAGRDLWGRRKGGLDLPRVRLSRVDRWQTTLMLAQRLSVVMSLSHRLESHAAGRTEVRPSEPRNDWSESQLIDPQFTFRFDNRVHDAQVPRPVTSVGARLRRKRELVDGYQEFQVQGEGFRYSRLVSTSSGLSYVLLPFQDDFFLKFHPLDNAIGQGDIGTLMQALEDFAPTFKRIWKQQVETKLLGGGCKVDVSLVASSYCLI